MKTETEAAADPRPWLAPLVVAIVALVVRLVLVGYTPGNWHFDAYQRWAGRDHLLVQVWLPATQSLVWLVAALGGGVLAMRLAFSAMAALVLGLASAVAGRVGGRGAAWFMMPLSVFGPFLCWSIVPYQESTFLLVLFGALLLWRRAPLLADLVMGSIALVRYEGWPLLAIWLILRRDKRALLSLWGAALWIGLKLGGFTEPFMASPDRFADWEGLTERWSLARHAGLLKHVYALAATSGLPWLLLAAPFALRRPWARETTFLVWALVGQLLALIGWTAALDHTSSRMLVIPGVLLGVLAAMGLARAWALPWRFVRPVLLIACLVFAGWTLRDGVGDARFNLKAVRKDLKLVEEMRACVGDSWAIVPRPQPGPRLRHDGCEVIQGVTNLRAGVDFQCVPWGWGGPEPSLRATWSEEESRYEIERLSGAPVEGCAR